MSMTESILPPDELMHGEKFKFIRQDWIDVYDLGKYGFDEEIITGFIKYEVFPAVLKYKGKHYVPKFAILGLIHKILKNSIKIYQANEEIEAKIKEAEDTIAKDNEELSK